MPGNMEELKQSQSDLDKNPDMVKEEESKCDFGHVVKSDKFDKKDTDSEMLLRMQKLGTEVTDQGTVKIELGELANTEVDNTELLKTMYEIMKSDWKKMCWVEENAYKNAEKVNENTRRLDEKIDENTRRLEIKVDGLKQEVGKLKEMTDCHSPDEE